MAAKILSMAFPNVSNAKKGLHSKKISSVMQITVASLPLLGIAKYAQHILDPILLTFVTVSPTFAKLTDLPLQLALHLNPSTEVVIQSGTQAESPLTIASSI